tara:strand:+ start:6382 stop:6819 length:438 start_codon:yes stop_codon:yes gene_type:complete
VGNKNFTKSWQMEVGLNNVPAYQVGGRPFASGGINCSTGSVNRPAQVVEFPFVTRWITIVNKDIHETLKVGFSKAGVDGTNYFSIPKHAGSPGQLGHSAALELKVSQIWISGSTNVDIVAGLTTIRPERTSGSAGPSWSGSVGVG